MATQKQIAANRRNAQKSSGPKSQAGKSRAALNSLKHGLSVPNGSVDGMLLEKLAARIAGGNEVDAMRLARGIAAAELELARVRRISSRLWEQHSVAPASGGNDDRAKRLIHVHLHEAGTFAEFAKLIRYEKRAAFRRDRAVREFLEAGRCVIDRSVPTDQPTEADD